MLRFLRRIAVLALVLALSIWAVPRVLVEAGVLGPTAAERIDEAARAIVTAKSYGAGEDVAALALAERELERARSLAGSGREREARSVAKGATAAAIEAQKMALVAHTEVRQQAETVYNDLDRQINDLEKLYAATAPGLQKEQTSQLLSLMKVTRQSTGVLFLAYERKDYGTVVDGQGHAREVIAGTRKTLEAARPKK